MNKFYVDPFVAGREAADRDWMIVVAKVMKKAGITQVDISDVEIVAGNDKIVMERDDTFLRIKGEFQITPRS